MSGQSNKEKQTEKWRSSVKRVPFYLWFFYLGLLCLSMTGVTFSRYFTTITGTISVQVADSYVVTFLDADEITVLDRVRVYEGQRITSTPDMSGAEAMLFSDNLDMDVGDAIYSDEDTVYRVFAGWKLQGGTGGIINPYELEIHQDVTLVAVYDISPEPPLTATPANATPSDATPSNAELSDDASLKEASSGNTVKNIPIASPSNAR